MKQQYQHARTLSDPFSTFLPELSLMEGCRDILESAIEQAGKLVLTAILQASAESLTGADHRGKAGGEFVRHGTQAGCVFLGRNKVRVARPRVRSKGRDGSEDSGLRAA